MVGGKIGFTFGPPVENNGIYLLAFRREIFTCVGNAAPPIPPTIPPASRMICTISSLERSSSVFGKVEPPLCMLIGTVGLDHD